MKEIYKLSKDEMLHHWMYFCSLTKRLNNTRQYVDHAMQGNEFVNGNVSSWEFQQLLILSAVEFESVAKIMCNSWGIKITKKTNIKCITDGVLNNIPGVRAAKVIYNNIESTPLSEWSICEEKVEGLAWWDDYNGIKHSPFTGFSGATLKNVVDSLASLMVLELYMMSMVDGSFLTYTSNPPNYFTSPYMPQYRITEGARLP